MQIAPGWDERQTIFRGARVTRNAILGPHSFDRVKELPFRPQHVAEHNTSHQHVAHSAMLLTGMLVRTTRVELFVTAKHDSPQTTQVPQRFSADSRSLTQ